MSDGSGYAVMEAPYGFSLEGFEIVLRDVTNKMMDDGFADAFVQACVRHARTYAGTFDLLLLWRDEHDGVEREAIIQDLREAIGWEGLI